MKNVSTLFKGAVISSTIGLFYSANAADIFSDQAINVWVVDPRNQAVTTYSTGQWVDDYISLQGFAPANHLQVLVNGLPNSSVPMSNLQPGVSIIGLGEADRNSTSYSGTSQLNLLPASMSSSNTIEVVMQIDADLIADSPVELRWQVNNGVLNSINFNAFETPDANGFYSKRLYLIEDGSYDLDVSIYQLGQLIDERQASYQINSDDPLKEKRDSDKDGVPDIIENAIGLDPLNSDLFAKTGAGNWSIFDIWLRCDQVDISACNMPVDTDKDGWSDFDENLRGTSFNDFELDPGVSDPDDEFFNQKKLLLQEKPAARRLYEVEYVFTGELGSNKFVELEAAELNGTQLFHPNDLVDNQDLIDLSVNAGELAPNILLSTFEQKLAMSQWPGIRLGASQSMAIRASRELTDAVNNADPSTSPSRAISLILLQGAGDINIQDFPYTQDGQWTNALEWRNKLIDWLTNQLVQTQQIPFTEDSTNAALLFEASLREEAFIANDGEAIRLGEQRLPATWINELQEAMQARESQSLLNWYQRISNNLFTNPAYADLIVDTKTFIEALPSSGTNTSEWLIERLRMPVVLSEQGCFVSSADLADIQSDPAYFEQYKQTCPLFYTELDLAQWRARASKNRYLLRMAMFEEGPLRLSEPSSLTEYEEDTDGDTLLNLLEVIQSPYATATYPWLADSDGDGVSDLEDECKIDPFNRCSGDPIHPVLMLGDDLQINLDFNDGIALLELVLSSPALEAISLTYYIEATGDDTANDGEDFTAMSGTLTFAPGQQSIVIPASLLASNEAGQTRFRIRIEDLNGASFNNDDNIQLVNVNRSALIAPNIQLAASAYTVNERQSLSFDASSSQSGIADESLEFLWTQTSGPSVVLSASNTDSPTFTAPETINSVDLGFALQVTNSDGGMSNASVTVRVNPVDDSPVVNGSANYTVARNDILSISKSELLTFISEPDGETLSITELVQTPTQGGTLTEDATHFEFTPTASAGRTTTQLDDNPLDTTAWLANGIAYRTAQTNTDPKVYTVKTWTPEQGTTVLDSSDTGFSGIKTDAQQAIIYWSRSDQNTSTTWIEWRESNGNTGEINTGGFASLFGSQIDDESSMLYHCMDSQWHRINPSETSTQQIALSCSRFGAGQARIDSQLCLTSDDGLYCSANGIDFEPIFRLPDTNARIDRIFSSDTATFIMYNDNTNQFIALVDGQTSGQVLHTLDNYFNFIQGIWLDDTFYTVLPVKRDAFDEGIQLFKWDTGDTQLMPVGEPDVFSDQVSRTDFSDLIVLGDNLLWYGQKSLSANAKYLINIDSGEFEQAGEDISGSRNLHAWEDSALLSSERLESFCQYFELDTNGEIADVNAPELERAGCFGRIVYGSTLAYTLFNEDLSLNEFYVKYGAGGVSDAQFIVRVEDENGNGVNLTVNIAISEGDE